MEAIERGLLVDELVRRYSASRNTDGLPPGEGVFLPCSFWLADCLILAGRRAEGVELFERLVTLCNDLGLYSEEHDTRSRRMLGNFPQAPTHMALINCPILLSMAEHEVAHAVRLGERPATATIRAA